ncbi:unnamed protein product, partial [Porites lobata]
PPSKWKKVLEKIIDMADGQYYIVFMDFVANVKEAHTCMVEELKHTCLKCHGKGMNEEEKLQTMSKFRNLESQFLVASEAYQVGTHDDHVNLVCRIGCPRTRIGWIHEFGRAGRNGEIANGIIYCNEFRDDRRLITWLRGVDSVEKEQIMRQYAESWRYVYCTLTGECMRAFLTGWFGEDPDLPLEYKETCGESCDSNVDNDYNVKDDFLLLLEVVGQLREHSRGGGVLPRILDRGVHWSSSYKRACLQLLLLSWMRSMMGSCYCKDEIKNNGLLINRRVNVETAVADGNWEGWFVGTIINYNKQTKQYKISFDVFDSTHNIVVPGDEIPSEDIELLKTYKENYVLYLGLVCREGWVENGNQCYFTLPEKKEAFVGLYLCKQLGATLPIIKSAEENDFLVSLTEGKGDPRLGMIGPNGDNVFEWLDGTAVAFSSWNSGEPNGPELENCG